MGQPDHHENAGDIEGPQELGILEQRRVLLKPDKVDIERSLEVPCCDIGKRHHQRGQKWARA